VRRPPTAVKPKIAEPLQAPASEEASEVSSADRADQVRQVRQVRA
jgi:hypothetical protein